MSVDLATVRCVSPTRDILGEGPKWSSRERALYWLDITGKILHRLDQAGSLRSTELKYGAASFAFVNDGRLLMMFMRGPALWSPDSGEIERLDLPGISPTERFNDSRCDSRGRLWTGTFDSGLKAPLGHLYSIDGDRRVVQQDAGIMMSNGIAFSPDEHTLYYCDSWPGRIYAYDFDVQAGTVTNRRALIDFAQSGGRPDGCVADAEGCLWVAEVDNWRIVRYRADGTFDRAIMLPVQKPTSVTFGGPDLTTLFITSRRSGLSEAELVDQPEAGGLFAVEVPVGGSPEYDYVLR